MTFYRIIFPLVLLSLMLMYLRRLPALFCVLMMYLQYLHLTSTYPLLRSVDIPILFCLLIAPFAFWWYTYSTFLWLLPALFCVLLMFIPYSVFFFLPFAFWWCTHSTLLWLLPTLFCILLMYLPLLLVSHSFSLIILLKTNLLHSQPHLQVHFSTMMTYLHPYPFLLTSHSWGHPLPFLPNIF